MAAGRKKGAAGPPPPPPSPPPSASLARASSLERLNGALQQATECADLCRDEVEKRARSLIEDHWDVDGKFRLLGPLRHDANYSRDVHDWFNIFALVPVVALNVSNWDDPRRLLLSGDAKDISELWHGAYFDAFWAVTFGYFLIDVAWMFAIPNCVRSPSVIVKHHVITMLYLVVPRLYPVYGWLMGANLLVEVNTWFLIARRVFNRAGDRPNWTSFGVPFTKSGRVKVISVGFYITWFFTRIVVYPCILFYLVQNLVPHTRAVGFPVNAFSVATVIQIFLSYLNLKWTSDLIRSKLKTGKTADEAKKGL